MKTNDPGSLYVVATPIGNLQDMTFRAVEVLKAVDTIVAEDTRHSQALLQHYSIKTPIMALHEFNERERTSRLLERIIQGESIALISDAGTPLISDPGYYLVHEAKAAKIKVVPVPGACAAIAALSASGLATDRFLFEGFLPVKATARQEQLKRLKDVTATLVFYEAPHRIQEVLTDMQTILGSERPAVIARELTKVFETIAAGTLQELVTLVTNDANQRRGEFVILVSGLRGTTEEAGNEAKRILAILLESLPLKQAVELTIQLTGQKKNEIYDLALQLKKSGT